MSVTATASQILPPQIGRVQYILRNVSANDMYISNLPDVSSTQGFLVKSGETVQFRKIDGDPTEMQVYAVAPAGASDLCVVA